MTVEHDANGIRICVEYARPHPFKRGDLLWEPYETPTVHSTFQRRAILIDGEAEPVWTGPIEPINSNRGSVCPSCGYRRDTPNHQLGCDS